LETDSTWSALALAISITIFGLTEIAAAAIVLKLRAQERILSPDSEALDIGSNGLGGIPAGPTAPFRLVNLGAVAASVLSAAALVMSRTGTDWLIISLGAAATLAVLGLLLATGRAIAAAWTNQIYAVASPLARILSWPLFPILFLQSLLLTRLRWGATNGEELPLDQSIDVDVSSPPVGEMLDEHEVRMIRGVVRLDTTMAREIMVPRVDILAVDATTPLTDLAEQMLTGGHSRIPVYQGDLDHIEGVAHARDTIQYLVAGKDSVQELTAGAVARPALFIPESKSLEELLDEFQEKRVHLAVVIDEYGGVSGIVTIEDLLEEIVGEIHDEFDVNEPEIQDMGKNEYFVDARLSIDQLREVLQVSVENTGYDTVGGFVLEQLGRIPSVGDIVHHDGMQIEVLSTVGRRLKTLKVTKTTT
jgi:CBS domain containing-hemolysin-like protein